jgi:hypothetical protein
MAYSSTGKLPDEHASKLGHLSVIQSQWVQSLIEDFEDSRYREPDHDISLWHDFDVSQSEKLKYIWAVDGSYASVKTNPPTGKEVAFIKTALLSIDKKKLDRIDKKNPHPLLLQDIMADSALFHATVLPLKNVKTSLGNNFDAIRHIIYDSMRVDEDGQYFQTLKWLAYKKWENSKASSPKFDCPHCCHEIPGLPFDTSKGECPHCNKEVLLTDMIGFHLDMEEESASEKIVSSYMLVMEHLMLFTIVRLMWHHTDKNVFSDTLFIKDGPLTLRSQYAKFVPLIRDFIEYTKREQRPIHIIGQEKSGVFHDHLTTLSKYVSPQKLGDSLSVAVLTHEYVRKEVYRTGDLANPYGSRTNWGEKVYVKLDPDTALVLNIPTGAYSENLQFPNPDNLVGLGRIMATLPELISRRHEGALFPVELANGVASMSSYPSAKILQRFIERK